MRPTPITIQRIAATTAFVAVVLLPTMLSMSVRRREQMWIDQLRGRGVTVWFQEDNSAVMEKATTEKAAMDFWYDRWSLVPSSWIRHPKRVSIVEFTGRTLDLSPLERLDTVKALSYVNASVDDDLIEVFMEMEALDSLNLSDTNVGDRALERLAGKPNLRYLNVMGSKVTPEGVKAFNAARGDCILSVSPDTEFMKWLNMLWGDK